MRTQGILKSEPVPLPPETSAARRGGRPRGPAGLSKTERVTATVGPSGTVQRSVLSDLRDTPTRVSEGSLEVDQALPTAAPPTPYANVRTVCPFSGSPIQFREIKVDALGGTRWQVFGDGWIATKSFFTKRDAEFWVSHNYGVPPSFSNGRVTFVRSPEPNDADDAVREAKEALSNGAKYA